ncbi:MAG: diaminopimelate decarboxylase [Armatimonadota bacterium]|nr:diaminopimelate decarboxylase [Armatimonadota bacterium]MDR7427415.1 diaminopimelate decarboxylase [Armatimonadota bacterium]MDR7464401.1 diaminopimelate decarboxylase [Armatimonadota bacterium]
MVLHDFPTDGGVLSIGGCRAPDLAAAHGTPLLVIDEERFRQNCRAYRESLRRAYPRSQPIYASKALCTLATCRLAYEEGLHVDVASGGEIITALRAGVPGAALHFHGNNKTEDELRLALAEGVGRIIVDNFYELELLDRLTRELAVQVAVLLRLTPGIEPHTHRAIQTGGIDSKFGFGLPDGAAWQAVRRTLEIPGIALRGFHCHIGSQIVDLEPFTLAASAMAEFAAAVHRELGLAVDELNLGGGLGIRYVPEDTPPPIPLFVDRLAGVLREALAVRGLPEPLLYLEPGRSIVGDAGVTLYTVGAIKTIPGVRTYASVDGGMFENPRPALYGARYTAVVADRASNPPEEVVAVAGRCCESGDVLIWEAALPALRPGDLLAVFSTGAYTYSMASNYNRFPRPAVVLAGGGRVRVVVERETYEDLVRKDRPLA